MELDILLVEDTEFVLHAEKLMLEQQGFWVTPAKDGHSAVSECKKKSFDVVLIDLGLPDINGIELAKLIKETSLNHETPIFALTAHTSEAEHGACLKAGMERVYVKPITNQLIEKLKKIPVKKNDNLATIY